MNLNKRTLEIYNRLRREPVSMLVGRAAEMALRDARAIARFEELKREGLVRMIQEEESESYFRVYGEPDTDAERKRTLQILERWGCYYVSAEFRSHDGEWETADGVGMCVYANPTSPFENCYVAEMMREAVANAELVMREPAERSHWEARDTVTI